MIYATLSMPGTCSTVTMRESRQTWTHSCRWSMFLDVPWTDKCRLYVSFLEELLYDRISCRWTIPPTRLAGIVTSFLPDQFENPTSHIGEHHVGCGSGENEIYGLANACDEILFFSYMVKISHYLRICYATPKRQRYLPWAVQIDHESHSLPPRILWSRL